MKDALSTWLRSIHSFWFVLLILAATYAVVIPVALLSAVLPSAALGPGPPSMHSYGLLGRLALGSLIAPLAETALFQWMPIRLLRRKLRLPWPIVVLTSAALFGATHTYSLGYVIFAFLVGLVLAYAFAVRSEPERSPFLLVAIVHAIRNAIATLLLS